MAPFVECGSRAYQVLTALVALRGLYHMGQNAKDMEEKISCYNASERNVSLYFQMYPNSTIFVHPTIMFLKSAKIGK